ncbi:MAG: hypothetical protein RJB16_1038 [Bacteroidota bacterium]|jgi:hypothetical protein
MTISLSCFSKNKTTNDTLLVNFLGNHYELTIEKNKIKNALLQLNETKNINLALPITYLQPAINKINTLQKELKLADWLVYQLIRRIAEQINSKYENYSQYTLTKFALLSAIGFEPLIYTSNQKILLYVKSSDTIYNLPNKIINGIQYICLNYHDYQFQINFQTEKFYRRFEELKQKGKDFNYQIAYLASFQRESYTEKTITFQYKKKKESYNILINTEMQDYFTNYPVTEYRYQFNIPFSEITYNTLIPQLKSRIKNLTINEGIEYIMLFVRDGFEFETDTKLFGREKRLSAEETLISSSSDCEDRSALFFSLVKEIYDLPMAILSYPEHVNVAVHLPKPKGLGININSKVFTICEPTPQKEKHGIGWMSKQQRKMPYEIAYLYQKQ